MLLSGFFSTDDTQTFRRRAYYALDSESHSQTDVLLKICLIEVKPEYDRTLAVYLVRNVNNSCKCCVGVHVCHAHSQAKVDAQDQTIVKKIVHIAKKVKNVCRIVVARNGRSIIVAALLSKEINVVGAAADGKTVRYRMYRRNISTNSETMKLMKKFHRKCNHRSRRNQPFVILILLLPINGRYENA